MTEFLRVAWVSEEARQKWDPIFHQITAESNRVEMETVRLGMRKCGLHSFNPRELSNIAKQMAFRVLDVNGYIERWGNTSPPYKQGEPFMLRTVVGKEADVEQFACAYRDGHAKIMGDLLGYPECCIAAFDKWWVREKKRDFTWEMLQSKTNQRRMVVYPWESINPLLIRVGVRLISHLPCTYHCYPSLVMAQKYEELWDEQLLERAHEILSWPLEWSSLHGAAEIRTPVCKIICSSEYKAKEHVIQFAGENYPAEGARGRVFPYTLGVDRYSNNGFSNEDAMRQAHGVIEQVARHADASSIHTIYDPGCGNGELLSKLGNIFPNAELYGVDINPHAVAQAQKEFITQRIEHSDMFSADFVSASMVVLMPGRLSEVEDYVARQYVDRLRYKYLLLYGYADNAATLWDLKASYFNNLKVVSTVNSPHGVAALLEAA